MNDEYFMQIALDLAIQGQGFTSPNPMVGAVIVKQGKIVGQGYHHAAGMAHAEVNAINDAGDQAKDATIYVTLEPCNHTGRTPPCTEKILKAGIRRVVIAMKDPNPDVKGGGAEYLRAMGIDITLGICENEAKRLNEAFIKYVTTKKPFVILKCAATLDGYIATKTGDSKWVSGEKSRQYVHRLRHAVDAIMVGCGTVIADNPHLTTRLPNIKGKDPIRIILDTNLSIPENSWVITPEAAAGTIIVTGPVFGKKKQAIENNGVQFIESPLKQGMIDLDSLMSILSKKGITSILIEGGSRVIGSAFREKIVDKIIFFFAPKIMGGNEGIPICRGQSPEQMEKCLHLHNISVQQFDDDIMVEGYMDLQFKI